MLSVTARMFVVGRAAVAACMWFAACSYRGGSFAGYGQDFAGVRSTFGCIDASVARRSDLASDPVIAYEFGNGCDQPVAVDLSLVTVSGRDAAGGEVVLRPYDPDHEIKTAVLDGRRYAAEAIEYVVDDAAPASLAEVCVDPSSAFGGQLPRWSCFASAR